MTGQSTPDHSPASFAYRDTNVTDVSTALVMQIGERTNMAVDDLPPLYDTIDPEALNRLLDSGNDNLRVTFEYCSFRVTLGPGQIIEIHPLE